MLFDNVIRIIWWLLVKYCFNDVLQITEEAKVMKSDEKKDYEIKPIFIVGVPRCGSTLLEKIFFFLFFFFFFIGFNYLMS